MRGAQPLAEPRAGRGPLPGRNIVAVASGKGGVGKTWFAVTLSHALARLGRRVLLFDGDLGLANVDIQLGLVPERDLAGVIAGRIALGQAVVSYADGGFDIVAGHSGSGALAGLTPQRLQGLGGKLRQLAPGYDRVVVDLGAGVEGSVRSLTGPASACLVLATDEPTSLTDAYAFIKLTRRDYPETDLGIVVNLAATAAAGERTYRKLLKACESFLGFAPPLMGVVRRDHHVPDAIRAQTPLLTRHPRCDAARDVEAIAAKLSEATP